MEEGIQISSEIESFIIPLKSDQFKQLEKNLLEEGCRDPLVIWEKDKVPILIDGHNRYKICEKHHIPFKTTKLNFKGIDDVKIWLINNQIGRRNLNPEQISYYRGLKYENLKNQIGGFKNVLLKGKHEDPTSSKVAKEFKVSESTIKRDAKFARGIDFIGKYNSELKNNLLLGNITIKKSDILLLADKEIQNKIRKIINEKDLKLKIEKIRRELIEDIEEGIERYELTENSDFKDPLFLNNDDKINQLKGKILSSINVAIKNKDTKVLEKIFDHLEKLKLLISDD